MSGHDSNIVVGIGELLWDCFDGQRRPGGAPANVAYHATQLGLRGAVLSRVGTDEPGDALCAHLRERGLDERCLQRDPDHPTGRVTVDASRADAPSYTIHENVAWDFLEYQPRHAQLVAAAAAVCFGTLAQRAETSRTTIRRLLADAAPALRVYDVNLRPPWCPIHTVVESLALCDVVKLNADEARQLASVLALPHASLRDTAEALLQRFAPRVVCITRAERGSLLLTPHESVESPGCPTRLVDAVGAGDAFTAALIFGLLQRWPLDRIGRLANTVGALVASRPGAMPDIRDDVAPLLHQS